jgi:hypothetical protein
LLKQVHTSEFGNLALVLLGIGANNLCERGDMEPVILLLLGRGLPSTEAEQRQVTDIVSSSHIKGI